ncbi:IS481 family transposase [Streptomyces lydicus]|uniref:IS481 family transposase n=1 Tax=Streptomyces lydicus TaxID=47763 RepID=UPI0033234B4E
MSHRNARLPLHGRRLLVERVHCGRPVARVAAEMGISRPTAHKWMRRWLAEGDAGLHDRSSRPHRTPHRTAPDLEDRVCTLRQTRKLGPARIGPILGLPAYTVHRILARRGLHQLAWLDRPTGEPIRRYERARPGEMVHVDIKKLGSIPDGGGWRTVGRTAGAHNKQATTDQRKSCKPGAQAFFAAHGITVERVLTDNGSCYKSKLFTRTLTAAGITHKRIRPYRPQTNGKVERFNRTLLDEWAYLRPYTSNTERTQALTGFLHTYNHHRSHTALGGKPPISRVNNAPGQYT